MTINQFDTIELSSDILEDNLKAGMRGTVLEIFDTPSLSYEVEFSNKTGETVALIRLFPNQIKKLESISYEEYHKSKPD